MILYLNMHGFFLLSQYCFINYVLSVIMVVCLSVNSLSVLFKQLENKKYFSTFDLKSGFYHCKLEEKDKQWTTFITPQGLYEMNVLPFGYLNSPAEF